MKFRDFYKIAKAHVVWDFCIKKETVIQSLSFKFDTYFWSEILL